MSDPKDHTFPVTAVNPETGEAFDTTVVTTEPGGMTVDMTDPNHRVVLDHMVQDGTLTRTRGLDESDPFYVPGALAGMPLMLLEAGRRTLRAQDCAVALEQELAQVESELAALRAAIGGHCDRAELWARTHGQNVSQAATGNGPLIHPSALRSLLADSESRRKPGV